MRIGSANSKCKNSTWIKRMDPDQQKAFRGGNRKIHMRLAGSVVHILIHGDLGLDV